MAPAGFLIGRSVHSLGEMEEAVDAAGGGGCDYLTFGTVFRSAGKPDRHTVEGLAALAEVCARSPLPVIAIGGMTAERVDAVEKAGAAGFAAVGMFMCLTPLSPVV
jgi:thiamine-phosphate pyrophosphorylase